MSEVVEFKRLQEAYHRRDYRAKRGCYLVTGRNPSEDKPDRRIDGQIDFEEAKTLANLLAENDNTRIWHVSDDTGTWLHTVDTGMLQLVHPR